MKFYSRTFCLVVLINHLTLYHAVDYPSWETNQSFQTTLIIISLHQCREHKSSLGKYTLRPSTHLPTSYTVCLSFVARAASEEEKTSYTQKKKLFTLLFIHVTATGTRPQPIKAIRTPITSIYALTPPTSTPPHDELETNQSTTVQKMRFMHKKSFH